MSAIAGRQGWKRRTGVFRGTDDDIRAMKRALANAPLGPTAVLALSSAIIALEEDEPRTPAPASAPPPPL
jgi:hypothetical protein